MFGLSAVCILEHNRNIRADQAGGTGQFVYCLSFGVRRQQVPMRASLRDPVAEEAAEQLRRQV
jgi:hypothetical protein